MFFIDWNENLWINSKKIFHVFQNRCLIWFDFIQMWCSEANKKSNSYVIVFLKRDFLFDFQRLVNDIAEVLVPMIVVEWTMLMIQMEMEFALLIEVIFKFLFKIQRVNNEMPPLLLIGQINWSIGLVLMTCEIGTLSSRNLTN